MSRFETLCLVAFSILFCICSPYADNGTRASFVITPKNPLMDDRLSIQVSGLPSNQLITIRAKSEAKDKLSWKSEAEFNSGPKGTIDLSAQAPVSGSYVGVDAMGLFWSMKPEQDPKSGDHAFFEISDCFRPVTTQLEAVDTGRVLGFVTIERRFAKPGIRCAAIKEGGIHGFQCDPGDGGRHSGMMLLGGSEGGPGPNDMAALLASHNFTALSLAYFNAEGLPSTLQNIPMEYFDKALKWLRALPQTDPEFVGVFGISRGAEAALQFASMYPEVKAVIARSPSHVRWEGVGKLIPGGHAWIYRGEPLPYLPIRIPLWFAAQSIWKSYIVGDPVARSPLFKHNLATFGDTASVEIPVENIHGPVLLLSGKDDQTWPSSLMATRIIDRLQHHRHPYSDAHLSYDKAGHWIPYAYLPTAGERHKMPVMIGGTPEGTARAQADSWSKILDFLIKASKEKKESQQ